MTLHPAVANAIQEIDAALFSSDMFQTAENRMELRKWLDRWQKWDKEATYFSPDGTLLNADGTRSIFDDVDD